MREVTADPVAEAPGIAGGGVVKSISAGSYAT